MAQRSSSTDRYCLIHDDRDGDGAGGKVPAAQPARRQHRAVRGHRRGQCSAADFASPVGNQEEFQCRYSGAVLHRDRTDSRTVLGGSDCRVDAFRRKSSGRLCDRASELSIERTRETDAADGPSRWRSDLRCLD